ncbi:hypothetical protein EXIGLDRAFT_255826 [Exidia glandulosa HHB12029]|uniref:Uncharacterized protein n=1 Tax=Exidia glandulosa HHB12029 TaxID=1314781 RepID=A0A165DVS9_EXIGL|nr:hypothetical protein EXIGLDRAFT_255826 [Exidia glandulosa HHB12029]
MKLPPSSRKSVRVRRANATWFRGDSCRPCSPPRANTATGNPPSARAKERTCSNASRVRGDRREAR